MSCCLRNTSKNKITQSTIKEPLPKIKTEYTFYASSMFIIEPLKK